MAWAKLATDSNLTSEKVGGLQRVEELRQEREGYIEDQLLNGNLQPKPFARETLALAREKGLKTALATSSMAFRGENYWIILNCRMHLISRHLVTMSQHTNQIRLPIC